MRSARLLSVVVAVTAAGLAAVACSPASSNTANTASPGSAGASGGACAAGSLHTYKSGLLTVATDSPAYAPWFDNNDPSDGKGFESAVAYAVAGRLGFARNQVRWVVEPFDSSYAPGAKQFDFDVNEISITAQRAEAVDFSTGYYSADQGILVLNGSKYAAAASLSQLKDAKIGVQVATTSYQAVVEQLKPSQQPNVYNTTNDEINALRNHQVDAVITDMPTVFYLASAQLDNGKIVGQFSYGGSEQNEEFGLLLQKNSPLTKCVDQAIGALQAAGQLKQIEEHWLSASANVPFLKP